MIFGGTSGIGLTTVIDFIKHGASHIIIAGRSEWKWERAKNILEDEFGKYPRTHSLLESINQDNELEILDCTLEYIKCDVRLESNVKNLLENVIDKYKYINVYFNNAGVQPVYGDGDGDDITKLDIESYQSDDGSIYYRIPGKKQDCSTPTSDFCENPIATSIIGLFYCLKWEMYYAFKQTNNIPVSIINTCSRNGINIPSYERPIYSGSKAFIHSITQTIATQAAIKGLKYKRSVRINCIAPGPILTPLEIPLFVDKEDVFDELSESEFKQFNKIGSKGVPMQRTGFTNEISPTVLFLSDYTQSSYITGSTITIDGGYTSSPYFN